MPANAGCDDILGRTSGSNIDVVERTDGGSLKWQGWRRASGGLIDGRVSVRVVKDLEDLRLSVIDVAE